MSGSPSQPRDGTSPLRSDHLVWITERIRNGDTDQFQHVNNAAIASYCEAGRIALFDMPLVKDAMIRLNVVVVTLTINFERELLYPGSVDIGTSITKVGNSSFSVSQSLYLGGDRFATSTAVCVMMDSGTRKPARVPDAVRLLVESFVGGQS